MSGTSLDGVDVALCEIDAHSCKLLASHEYPFVKELKQEVLRAISEPISLSALGALDHKLGILFADSVNDFLAKFNIDFKDVKAIGLHGQTLWHEPSSTTPFSMQLGDANLVTAKTQIKTVADFRRMDMANGGEGAPFTPVFHQFLFGSLGERVAVLNIGGMANITLLGERVLGWDSGCGNVLLDYWMSQTQLKPYDKDGEFARSGDIDEALLALMLGDAYFIKEPPKSTGREYFNASWLEEKLTNFSQIKAEDVQRTLLELTALSISNDLQNKNITTLIVCGGGAKNKFLIERLSALNTCEVKHSDDLGVSSDAMEAMAFAWFAYKRLHNENIDLCSVTGATKPSLLGAIYG